MTKIKAKFYSDAGHGWLAVKKKVLDDLNISNKISVCSYQRGATVYLEEDSDASTFADAIKAAGCTLEVKQGKWTEYSPIRSYDRYQVEN